MGRLVKSDENGRRRRQYVELLRRQVAIVEAIDPADARSSADDGLPRARPGEHAQRMRERLRRAEAGEPMTVAAWEIEGVSPYAGRFVMDGDGRLAPID